MNDLYNHETKEGIVTPIVMLDDVHLVNIIRMHLRSLENARLMLEQKDKPVSTVVGALYKKQRRIDPTEMITQVHEALMPYVVEALLRGLEGNFATQMRLAYGYTEQKTIESLPF